MNKLSLSLVVIVGITVLSLSSAGIAIAEDRVEQSAEQSQTLKVECKSGAYGQDSNCTAEGTQNQKLHQVITYSKVLGSQKIHTPVNTAVDASAMLAVLATGLTGIGAFIGYTRIK